MLGSDGSGAEIVEHYNKSIAIDANDVDPNDSTPQGVVAAITKKDDDDGQGYLERLDKGRPPIEEVIKRPQKIQHAQKLLDWLQHWAKPTISARDICIYGPRPI